MQASKTGCWKYLSVCGFAGWYAEELCWEGGDEGFEDFGCGGERDAADYMG